MRSIHTSDGFPEGRVLLARLMRHGRLRQLQLLQALQQCGSIVRAAAELDMSQSAATQALAELERVLGLRLFERHARGIRPTPAGQVLIDAARGMLNELEDAAQTLAAIRLGASGALRLGAIPSAAHAILAPLLPRFYARHPRVHVDVKEAEGPRLLALLISGGLDAVFCREPPQLPVHFVFEPLLADEAVFVAAVSHPLAGSRDLPLAALGSARWVLPTSNIAVRDVFERVVLAQLPQAQWFPVATVSLPVLQGLLSQPHALALVPHSIVRGLGQSRGTGGIQELDVRGDRTQRRLPSLGAVYQRDGAPQLLREMLALWGAVPAAARS